MKSKQKKTSIIFSLHLGKPIAATRKTQAVRCPTPCSWRHFTHLLVLLVNAAHVVAGILILLEGVCGDLVQADCRLVGVLDKHVLAVVLAHDHVDECADDSPAVVEVEVHLGGELAGLVAEHAEDDVVGVALGVGTGDETVMC
jgi:hypothetical protein